MSIKNNIVKPVLYTFLVMLFLLIATFSVLHFFYPLTLCNWYYSMGANNLALKYSERAYNKTHDYNQLYSTLNLAIKINKYDKVVVYYEKFSQDDNYLTFVTKVDINNSTKKVSNLVKSSLYSEDNYLKNKYVLALTKTNNISKAYTYANSYTNFDFEKDNLGLYLFNYLFDESNEYDGIENLKECATKLSTYFDNAVNIFNQYTDDSQLDNLTKVKALVLGNRINEVGKNLKAIKEFNGQLIDLTEENINGQVREVNNKMPLFI